jgi:hypothetical protein
MTTRAIHHSIARWLCALLLLSAAGWAAADPPSRVARLAYVSGESSFSPGGERDWARAVVNRPLITGDRLWVDRGGRAELQLGIAAIRVGSATSIRLLNLDDRVTQIELPQGTLNLNVRRLDRGDVFEVDTPNLAFSIRRPGSYRIEVDADGQATMVTVRRGLAEVYGEGRGFIVGERRSYRFYDTGLTDYEFLAPPPFDELDRWASDRDGRWDRSASRRYVSAEVIGYQDLDQFGTWRRVPDYGYAWVPRSVPAGWAPYQEGHWVWVEPWGWTWVDEAPWGFAPSHYGRWAWVDRTWMWVPGPVKARPVYAPALVAFVGGGATASGGGATVAWFPLGPRDVYRPSYTVSRSYFVNVNTSNTVVNNTIVTNVYEHREQPNVTYVNRQVPGALVAVLAAVITQSRPVHREATRVNVESLARAPVVAMAPVAPVRASVVGPAPTNARPPERAERRPVVAQTPPPPPPVPFAARQGALAAQPGKPLEPAAVAALKPAAAAAAPTVTVVKPVPPVAVPPAPPASHASPAAQAARAARAASTAAPAPAPAPAAAPAPAPQSGPTAVPARPAPPVPPAAAPAPRASQPTPVAPPSAAAASRERLGQGGAGEAGGRGRNPEGAAATAVPVPAAPAPAAGPAAAPPPRAPAAAPVVPPGTRASEARPAPERAAPTRPSPPSPAPAASQPAREAPAAVIPRPAPEPQRGAGPQVTREAAAPPALPPKAEERQPPVPPQRPAAAPPQSQSSAPSPARPAAPPAPPVRAVPPPAAATAAPPPPVRAQQPASAASAEQRGGRRAGPQAKAQPPHEAASEPGDPGRQRAEEQRKP